MQTVHVSSEQLKTIKSLASEWDGHERWLPKLDRYLWEQDIPPNEDCSPQDPSSYRFLAGGVDHIDVSRQFIVIHDRCMQRGSFTDDGTTKFVCA